MPDVESQQTDQQIEQELGWAPEPAGEPEVTAPPAAPAAAPPPVQAVAAPVLSAPVAPAVDPLASARAELRAEQVKLSITQAAHEFRQSLIAQGMDAPAAQQQAETAAREYWANFQRDEALNQANESVKQALIRDLSREHGVPAQMLAGFTDPASMRAAATVYGAQAKELVGLKAKVETPKAPVQRFDGGSGASVGAVQAKRNDYTQGKGKALNATEFEALHGWRPI